jgi:primosomal protein N' (replication factor Y)
VTGSGKTLVYLEAIRRALARGEGAIVLVPEISLTPQTVARLRGAFGDAVAVLHSGLSDGERADAWRALRRGERRVAVGARSAIFAPIERLGIIAIDEEHEATYKNGEAPRYHARDVARVRARHEGARCLLGSATPSLETLALVPSGVREIRLPARVGDRPLPPVEIVDLRRTAMVAEAAPVPWSVALEEGLVRAVARGEQAILLLNRRGFASFLQCGSCGEVPQCPSCSISLTVHQHPPMLRCHYCGHEERLTLQCRACGAAAQAMKGVGTQQLEEVVAARVPTARIARMDLDTTSTKWSHQTLLDRVERHEVDVLIGTQMIAKGLDFPNVTFVGVIDADTGLHLPDFRAAERTFQLLAQVAGRAGRGPKGGRVFVQTRNPTHHALVHASTHDTDGFVKEEMTHRTSPPYPPTNALVNLLCSGEDEQAVSSAAAGVADWCQRLMVKQGLDLQILGPAPAPLVRLKGRWRWHVVLKGAPAVLGRVVRYAARRLTIPGDVRVVIDRDPVSLL